MVNPYQVRKPTEAEYLLIEEDFGEAVTKDLNVRDYFVAVIDGYISDSPGYVGRLFLVVWGQPGFFNVLREIKHKDGSVHLCEVDQEVA